MANENYPKNIGICVVFLLIFYCTLRHGVAIPNRVSARKILGLDHDGIECIDIYKQPAFNHPLLKNHSIQLNPSSSPRGLQERKLSSEIFQGWKNKYGECPEGTIPIVRSQVPFPPKSMPPVAQNLVVNNEHEYAKVSVTGDAYYGASAGFNVWNPKTSPGEFSLAQFWLVAGQSGDRNTIEAGWQVWGTENKARLFIFWTSDGYQSTGCYNLDCPGFVQTSKMIGLGSPFAPLSTYGGEQYEAVITVHKDAQSGNWWLNVQGQDIGYWPSTIFTNTLADSATRISWGGEIVNLAVGHHTSTQMGSGHFPVEGFGKASFIRHLQYFDGAGNPRDAEELKPFASNPRCYDLQIPESNDEHGTHFFYGGPGYSDQCP